MKELFIDKKWVGAILLVIYSLFGSLYMTRGLNDIIHQSAPMIVQEVEEFLPITIEGGKIVAPENVVISKNYGTAKNAASIVLNTKVDEFDAADLNKIGVYISKKYIYIVQANKTEIHKISEFPNITINRELLNNIVYYIDQNAGRILFFISFFGILLITMLMITIYTALIHWLMALLFKAPLTLTLRLNTLGCIAIPLLGYLTPIKLGLFASLIALLVLNMAYNHIERQQ